MTLRALFLAAFAAVTLGSSAAAAPSYPPTPKHVVRDTLHGVVIEDHYRWLEDQKAPATRAWLDREISFTDSVLGTIPGRSGLEQRIAELLKVDTQTVPQERGNMLFFTRRAADQDLSVLCMRAGPAGKDEVLVDPHNLSADHTVSVIYYGYSADGSLVGIGTRTGGEDEVTISFLDVKTRKELTDRLRKARYFGVEIRPDRKGVFFSRMDAAGPRVHYHAFGSDTSSDRIVFGDGYGPEKILGLDLSDNGRWLILTVLHGAAARKVEIYAKDVFADGPVFPIVNDVEAWFGVRITGDHLYLRTNWEAPNQRVLRVDLTKPAREQWQVVIPEGEFAMDELELSGGRLVTRTIENVVPRLRVYDEAGKPLGEIKFETLGAVGQLSGQWSSNNLFFTFQSVAVPPTTYRYEVASGKRSEWFRERAPVKSEDFQIEQVWFNSRDGVKVPMFVASRKGLKLDGNNPTLLWGYGGFTLNQLPTFSHNAVVWMERGGVFALANLRGGSEFGERWHRDGMLERKQNTFDDFIAAAEALIEKGYTKSSRLAIGGGSNGGLLVSAAMTQRPDLFRAVYCAVPLIDMVRYHKFLVARFWVPEYGSSEDPEQFKYIYAYSPYHHVKTGTQYPAVLFMSGDSDTRVDPSHARKMAALMQASTGSDHPVLLHYDVKQGHSRGGKATSLRVRDDTDRNLFLMWQLGVLGGGASVSTTR